MKRKNKILLVESDPKLSVEICRALKNSGYEITDAVPFIYNVIHSIVIQKPDILMIDIVITEQMADFISNCIKLPLILISDQYEKEIYTYSDKLRILTIIPKPFNVSEIKTPVAIAFNKLY